MFQDVKSVLHLCSDEVITIIFHIHIVKVLRTFEIGTARISKHRKPAIWKCGKFQTFANDGNIAKLHSQRN